MPLRMKLNPKVRVFFQPPRMVVLKACFLAKRLNMGPKKHLSTDSSWFELRLLKYHCSVALSMFCQVLVEMYRSFLQDDFGSTNWNPNGHYLRTHSKGTTWFWPKLRLEARFLWIWPVAPIVWMWKQALLMRGKRENMDLNLTVWSRYYLSIAGWCFFWGGGDGNFGNLKWPHEAKGTKGISPKNWQHKDIDHVIFLQESMA